MVTEQSTTSSLSLRQCIVTNWIEMSMYTKRSNILIKTTAGKLTNQCPNVCSCHEVLLLMVLSWL